MKNSITIRKIETIRYFINEFVILNIYIFELINDKIEMIEIIVKIHLVHNLKIKFLVAENMFYMNNESFDENFFLSDIVILSFLA